LTTKGGGLGITGEIIARLSGSFPTDLVVRSGMLFGLPRREPIPGGFLMSYRLNDRVFPFVPSLFMLGALAAFAGCEDKGPAEKAGESIDRGVQNAKDAVNPPGPTEKAGRAVDKALKP
jgi:hypothetical protein